jgi:hypothetical protein
MAKNLELPPHIDANDFDAKWQASAATGLGFVPIRFEFKRVGRVTTTVTADDKIEVCRSSDGQMSNSQSVALRRFTTNGHMHVCLECPECGHPRQRLFLVPVRNKGRMPEGNMAFAFTCKKCGGLDATWARKSWQRQRTFSQRRRGVISRGSSATGGSRDHS